MFQESNIISTDINILQASTTRRGRWSDQEATPSGIRTTVLNTIPRRTPGLPAASIASTLIERNT